MDLLALGQRADAFEQVRQNEDTSDELGRAHVHADQVSVPA